MIGAHKEDAELKMTIWPLHLSSFPHNRSLKVVSWMQNHHHAGVHVNELYIDDKLVKLEKDLIIPVSSKVQPAESGTEDLVRMHLICVLVDDRLDRLTEHLLSLGFSDEKAEKEAKLIYNILVG